jgi:hypothetical protein
MRGRTALGWILLLACAVAAQAVVERAIITARELERRTKLNSYVLGVCFCRFCGCILAALTWAGPRPANVPTAWLSLFAQMMRALQSDQFLRVRLHALLCI